MEDLDAATLDDVHEWFKTYYGAANAVLRVAGDVDAEEVKAQVERYFGDIPSGPAGRQARAVGCAPSAPAAQPPSPCRTACRRRASTRSGTCAAWGTPTPTTSTSGQRCLADGKTSRLYKRLVYDDQIATDVVPSTSAREIGGLFIVMGHRPAGPGSRPRSRRRSTRSCARFLAEGPTAEELERVKTEHTLPDFVRGIERIGGFGGKSGHPGRERGLRRQSRCLQGRLRRVSSTATSGRGASGRASSWLSDGIFMLEVHPFPEYQAAESRASTDRPARAAGDGFPAGRLPETRADATLSNGLKVILAERHAVPVVDFELLLDAGYAADQFAAAGNGQPGDGHARRGHRERARPCEISERARAARRHASAPAPNLDTSFVGMLGAQGEPRRVARPLRRRDPQPGLPGREFERLQASSSSRRSSARRRTPIQMALRVFPRPALRRGSRLRPARSPARAPRSRSRR